MDEHGSVALDDGRVFGLARYGSEDGMPVLALHGAPACRLMFDVADAAARSLGLCLYCPERPGYGMTPREEQPTLDGRVEDLLAIADRLGLQRFAVLGISGGGPYGVAVAAKAPSRVTAVGLVSPLGPIAEFVGAQRTSRLPKTAGRIAAGHRLFFLELPKRKRLLKMQASLGARAFKAAPKAFSKLFAHSLSHSDTKVLAQPHVERSLIAMTLEALRQGVVGGEADLAVFSKPWGINYSAITAPTDLWQGCADRIVPAAASVWLSELIPGCRLHRLEGAGHFWVYDHVREVLQTLKESAGNATASP